MAIECNRYITKFTAEIVDDTSRTRVHETGVYYSPDWENASYQYGKENELFDTRIGLEQPLTDVRELYVEVEHEGEVGVYKIL